MTETKRGVYFLASDRLFELVVAFLNSFRKYNPDISLCLIPFNDDCTSVLSLSRQYNFSVLHNNELFEFYDEISRSFHPNGLGHYRKLGIWQGEFDEFIYIDVDTVVLDNFDFVFDLLGEYDFVAGKANFQGNVRWVWKNSIYDAKALSNEQINYSANTGFIASKKTALTMTDIRNKMADAISLAKHMELFCCEQPLLNYLIVTSGKTHTALNTLANVSHGAGIKTEKWAGEKDAKVKNGVLMPANTSEHVLYMHWAGQYQLKKHERKIRNFFRKIPLLKSMFLSEISCKMPYKKLWKYYRFLGK